MLKTTLFIKVCTAASNPQITVKGSLLTDHTVCASLMKVRKVQHTVTVTQHTQQQPLSQTLTNRERTSEMTC